MCLGALPCLALAPGCSGSDAQPNSAPLGGTGSSAGSGNRAGSSGKATGGTTSVSNGGSSAGTSSKGGAADGAVAEAGQGGAPLGGAAGTPGEGGSPELGSSGAAGECAAVVTSYKLSPGVHVAACTPIDYATNPPSSGEHYPSWADFGVYDFPLPRGYWMHNLEHGAVVVTYNCPDGCADDLAKAKAWLAQLTPDAACPAAPARILLVPDPLLEVAWAASSWGFSLRAECFDAAAFSDFFTQHAGQPSAPEGLLCGTGFNFRADGAQTCGAK